MLIPHAVQVAFAQQPCKWPQACLNLVTFRRRCMGSMQEDNKSPEGCRARPAACPFCRESLPGSSPAVLGYVCKQSPRTLPRDSKPAVCGSTACPACCAAAWRSPAQQQPWACSDLMIEDDAARAVCASSCRMTSAVIHWKAMALQTIQACPATARRVQGHMRGAFVGVSRECRPAGVRQKHLAVLAIQVVC